MSPSRPAVLVTDGEQRSTLAVVRSLGRAGYRVEVCSTRRRSLAAASRYCAREHMITDAIRDPGGYLDRLEAIIRSQEIGVLIPMTDVATALCLELRGRIPGLLLPAPKTETWRHATDKRRLMERAGLVGIATPDQFVLETPDGPLTDLRQWCDQTGYPVVLKPHRSAVFQSGRVTSTSVMMVEDPEGLERALEECPAEAYPLLVQRRLRGEGLGVFLLAFEGQTVATFGHRRLREKPPTGGVSVLRESVSPNQDLLEKARRLVESFEWSGVAMVEFKVDTETGEPNLMEINGRFWGSLQLAIDAGVDFPVALLEAFDGEGSRPSAPPAPYRLGVRSRWLWGDVDHLIWLLRAPRDYRLVTPALPSRVTALFRFLTPQRARFEVLRLTDPRPFVRESIQWLADLA